jgi:hypothetical protein
MSVPEHFWKHAEALPQTDKRMGLPRCGVQASNDVVVHREIRKHGSCKSLGGEDNVATGMSEKCVLGRG